MSHFTLNSSTSHGLSNSNIFLKDAININNDNSNPLLHPDFFSQTIGLSNSGGGGGNSFSGSDLKGSISGSGGSGFSGVASGGGGGTLVGVVEYVADQGSGEGPQIVAMDQRQTQHQEAYYLFFVGSMGMVLNLMIVVIIFLRRTLRRMTSAFLIHASFLNFVKAAFCIPFGINLLSDADDTDQNQPPNCDMQGSSFIVLLTTSAFNMVAMICTEAYTFQEVNVGGNSHGTTCCILFGVLVVYITAIILHLGPTLIGGEIVYNPDIGSCAFRLGSVTGYVANVMCIVIITFALVGVGHFLNKFYKEIQLNRPNRVSMLVRHSISITDDNQRQKDSTCAVHEMTQDAIHRARIFVITAVAFVLCWYPLFILIIMDMNFAVSPKVYQAFSFIAWSHPLVEPVILIFFDRNLNILSRFMYCDRDQYTASQIAYLLSQHQNRHQNNRQQQQQHQQPQNQSPLEDDFATDSASPAAASNSHNISMEIEDAFKNVTSGVDAMGGAHALAPPPPTLCRHCSSPGTSPHDIITSSSTPLRSPSHTRSNSSSADTHTHHSSSTHDLRGFQNFQPLAHGHASTGRGAGELEMNLTSVRHGDGSGGVGGGHDPSMGTHHGNIQC